MSTSSISPPSPRPVIARTVLRWTGRVLVGVWAAFWVWFNTASGISEIPEHGMGAAVGHGTLALLILGTAVLAYARPRIGGVALLVLTAAMGWFFSGARPDVLAMLLLPPGLGGLLTLSTIRRASPPAAA